MQGWTNVDMSNCIFLADIHVLIWSPICELAEQTYLLHVEEYLTV